MVCFKMPRINPRTQELIQSLTPEERRRIVETSRRQDHFGQGRAPVAGLRPETREVLDTFEPIQRAHFVTVVVAQERARPQLEAQAAQPPRPQPLGLGLVASALVEEATKFVTEDLKTMVFPMARPPSPVGPVRPNRVQHNPLDRRIDDMDSLVGSNVMSNIRDRMAGTWPPSEPGNPQN